MKILVLVLEILPLPLPVVFGAIFVTYLLADGLLKDLYVEFGSLEICPRKDLNFILCLTLG